MDDDGSRVWNGALFAVDFLEEPEDATGLVGHPVVRPAQVLVVPDVPQRLLLQGNKKYMDKTTNQSCEEYPVFICHFINLIWDTQDEAWYASPLCDLHGL